MDFRTMNRWVYTFRSFCATIPFTSLPPVIIARIFLLSGHASSLEELYRIMKTPGLGSHPVINEACMRAAVQRGWIHVEWPPQNIENENVGELITHPSVGVGATSKSEREGWIGRESYESTRSEDTIGPDINLKEKSGGIVGTGIRRSEDTIIFRVGSGPHGRSIASRGKKPHYQEPQVGRAGQVGKRNEYPRARITCVTKDAVVFPPAKGSITISAPPYDSLLPPEMQHGLISSTSLRFTDPVLPTLRERKSSSFFSSKGKAKSPVSPTTIVDKPKQISPDALSLITIAFSIKKLSLLRVTIWLPLGDCFALEDGVGGLSGIANKYLERILNLINRLEVVQGVEVEFILPPGAMGELLRASPILNKDMPTLYFGTSEGFSFEHRRGRKLKSLSGSRTKSRKQRDRAPPEPFATIYRTLVDALRLRDSQRSQNRSAEDKTCARFSFHVTDMNRSKHNNEGKPHENVGFGGEDTEEGITGDRVLRRSRGQEVRSPAFNPKATESIQEPRIKDLDPNTFPPPLGTRVYDLESIPLGEHITIMMAEKTKEKGKQRVKREKKEKKRIFDLKLNLSASSFDFMNAFPGLFRTSSVSSSVSSDAGSSFATSSSSSMNSSSALNSGSEAGFGSTSKSAIGLSGWKSKSREKGKSSPKATNYTFEGLNATSSIHHLHLESCLPFLPACLPATLNILTNLRTLHLDNIFGLAEEIWVDVLEALSYASHISEVRFERLHRMPLQALFSFLGETKKLEVLEVDRSMGYASMENGIEYEVNVDLKQLVRLRAPIDLLHYLFLYNDATVPSPPPHQTTFNFEKRESRSPTVAYGFERADVEMRQPFPKLRSLEILARTNDTEYSTYASLKPALTPLIKAVVSEEGKRERPHLNFKIALDVQILPRAEGQFSQDCTEIYASFGHKTDDSGSKEKNLVNEEWTGIVELIVSWHPHLCDLQPNGAKKKDLDKDDIKVRTTVVKDMVEWVNAMFPGLQKLILGRPFNEDAFRVRFMSEVVDGSGKEDEMRRWFGPEVRRSKDKHAESVRLAIAKRDQVVEWMASAVIEEFKKCAARFEVVVDGRCVDLWADKY